MLKLKYTMTLDIATEYNQNKRYWEASMVDEDGTIHMTARYTGKEEAIAACISSFFKPYYPNDAAKISKFLAKHLQTDEVSSQV